MNVSEREVDLLLTRLQHVVERSPVHLRTKRRTIMRGMRAALVAVADSGTLEGLRDELLYELTGIVPDKPAPRQLRAPDPLSTRDVQIIALLDQGLSKAAICRKIGCAMSVVNRCKALRDGRDQWQTNCADAAQHEVVENG